MKCPNCGFDNPDQFKFCGQCGTRLVSSIPQHRPRRLARHVMPQDHHFDAERRHITVVFCDLVGSTQLSGELDPEDFRRLLHVYQDTCGYAVDQYEGHIAQYLGDGVLIYFGYPQAHEDDSQRAVRCSLEIMSELQQINELQTQYEGINLAVRIGIHTGLVVVDEIGRDESQTSIALGDTPNIAARLQALADPNSIIISHATYRLAGNLFDCELLGPRSLKGVARKMDVFKVIGEKDIAFSYKTQITQGITPFIGRENEVQSLIMTWEEVIKGNGRIALLAGEPGIGKSRLLRVFAQHIKNEPHTWLVCQCIPYYQNSAFYPVINLIKNRLQYHSNDSNRVKLEKLEAALSNFDFDVRKTLPIMASLLSVPLTDPSQRLKISPQKQKELTIRILLDWLIRSSRRRPLLFVIEDVHWADASTLEHLRSLVDAIDRNPIMIILTFHSRFQAPVQDKSRITSIRLNRLSRRQIEHMVEEVSNGKIIPPEVIDLILTKTDGVPLFVEELTKMLLESGLLAEEDNTYKLTGSLHTTAVPDTLQDTLMARLDNLGAVKEVVQCAAVIGREFSFDLIRQIVTLDENTLKKELNNLVDADILEAQDDRQNIQYTFKQALIQDAAYNSILKSNRKIQHGKIANILEMHFEDFVEQHPEILAHHYAEARQFYHAIRYHLKAGRFLIEKSAHKEAIGQLRKGLQLLSNLEDEKERTRLELDIHIILGIALVATKGYSAAEVGRVYERAKELSQQAGDIPRLFPAMLGQYRFYLLGGDISKALDISELLLSWAQTSGEIDLMLEANRAVGATLFHMGETATCLQYLEEGIKIYDPARHGSHAHLYGSDPAVTCLSYAALAKCLLGFVEQALRYDKRSLQMAKKMEHPFSLAFALNHHSWLYEFLKNPEQVAQSAGELIAVSQEYGFPFWQVTGSLFKGWAATQAGNVGEGIEQMQQSMKAFRATGAGSVMPYFMAILADVYLENSQPDIAMTWLEKAETAAQANTEHFFDAEIYRLKGETLYAINRQNAKTAEKIIRRAIATARRQSSKILEIRAAMSLVRISGRKNEPLKMLEETYNWFHEGLDTDDLKNAQALLTGT